MSGRWWPVPRAGWIFLLASVLCPRIHAQMLRIVPDTEDPLILRFDPAFIARNGVKSISGQSHVKRDNEPMRLRNEVTNHRFGPEGRIAHENISFGRRGTGLDTTSVNYVYDAHGALVERLRNDLNGHYMLRNEVDSAGRPVRETYIRIENLGSDRYLLVPGTLTTISDERFAYRTINDTATRKTYFNDRGLPYREQTWSTDRLGYVRTIADHYLITERRGSTTFRYDEKGRLAERIERPDLRETRTTTHTWTYDKADNPLTCDVKHDGRPVRHIEYLYEEHTMLLKAVLTKETDTGMIHVMRYTTQR
jgi:hypothetical protein